MRRKNGLGKKRDIIVNFYYSVCIMYICLYIIYIYLLYILEISNLPVESW